MADQDLNEFDENLFSVRKSIDLTTENAHFFRSEGNLISMKLIKEDGEVEVFERIVPVRAFPLSDPDEFICIKEPESKEKGKGAEIGFIRRLSDFDEATVALLSEELSKRYFIPEISKIYSLKEKFGYCYFEAETSAGRVSFVMNNPMSNIRILEDSSVLMTDIDGNCFSIHDPLKIDKASYKKIEIYL